MELRILIFIALSLASLFSYSVIPTLSISNAHQNVRSSGLIVISNVDFETGNLSQVHWEITSPGMAEISQEKVNTGNWSAKLYTADGGPSGRVRAVNVFDFETRVNQRMYFYIDHWYGSISLMCFRNRHPVNWDVMEITVNGPFGGNEFVRMIYHFKDGVSEPGWFSVEYPVPIETKKWYYIEGEVKIGLDGYYKVYFGEAGQPPQEILYVKTDNSPAYHIDKVTAGVHIYASGHPAPEDAVIYIDDVAVAETYIGIAS